MPPKVCALLAMTRSSASLLAPHPTPTHGRVTSPLVLWLLQCTEEQVVAVLAHELGE